MDWSRAKTILIITFLILDIFLAAQINNTIEEKSLFIQTGNISDQQIQKFLKDNHVKMEIQPKSITQINPFTAEISTFTSDWVQNETGVSTKTYSTKWKLSTPESLNQFLQQEIPYFHSYKKFQETAQKITFLQYENTFPLFDGKLEIYLTKDRRVESIRILHFNPTKIEKINLISFNNALYNLLYSDDISPLKTPTITDALLGYRARSNPNTPNVYYLMPYWRFVINKKYTVDVNALNGNIEKSEN